MLALLIAAPQNPVVEVRAAYSEPDPDGIPIEGRFRWEDPKQSLVWYGEASGAGGLSVGVSGSEADAANLTATVGKVRHRAAWRDGKVDFGTFDMAKGPVRVALGIDHAPGPRLDGLEAVGPVRFAHSARRNAASVHLRWPVAKGTDVRWFYHEAAMLNDPQWSYTMACGFARGYFGMQVNSPTERRIIFSVWDAGSEAVDRTKVSDEDRVALVAKGDGVFADSFGNEGTGGHSHLVFPWKTGRTVRFLVGCRPEGEKTLYAGYFMAPGDRAWRLVAAFRAPKDGGPLRDLYSFSEDFVGANGQRWRESAFGNGWLGLADGSWKPVTKAVFTTDGHGKTERWDFDAFVKDGRFHLRHGGFVSGTARYGDALTLAKAGVRPRFDPPRLPESP